MAANAAGRAFRTPELLEAILLQGIPMRQLFTIQRTCRAFLDTINGSVLLKRSMFLEHEPRSNERGDRIEMNFNPLLFHAVFVSGQDTKDGVFLGDIPTFDVVNDTIELEFYILSEVRHLEIDLGRRGRRNQPLTRETQSWQRMLLLQPPLPQDLITLLHTRSRPIASATPRSLHYTTNFSQKPMTMGQLYHGLMDAYGKFLKARKKGWRRASDYILEHGGRMDEVMELASDDEE